MIVVRIELHSAVTGRKTEIGKMFIINDGSGHKRRRNYVVVVLRRRSSCRVTRRGKVKGHPSISGFSVDACAKGATSSRSLKYDTHNIANT